MKLVQELYHKMKKLEVICILSEDTTANWLMELKFYTALNNNVITCPLYDPIQQ